MTIGYADVLVGLQYGDEGKARVIDVIAGDYEVIARFNGGANAGHTIETSSARIALHQVPSGVMYPGKTLYIGSGCVVNIQKLASEIRDLEKIGIEVKGRLHISSQASIVQPHHIVVDSLTGGAIGTTKNGIGPAYSDRALRMDGQRLLNVRLGDLIHDRAHALSLVKENLASVLAKSGVQLDVNSEMEALESALDDVKIHIELDTLFLDKQVTSGARVLFEGAQSFMLDVGKGTVPYVTASHTVAGYAYVGGDLSPKYHRKTIGVVKAIMSRVGNGPFSSEFGMDKSEVYCMEEGGAKYDKAVEANLDCKKLLRSENELELGIALRILGNEYGSTTGRPRRVGSLDLVQLAYAARLNGVDELYVNKGDLLRDFVDTKFKGIPAVTKYFLGDREINYVPGVNSEYRQVKATTDVFPGFAEDVSSARCAAELPEALLNLLREIEVFCGCRIAGLGVGPQRDQFVAL